MPCVSSCSWDVERADRKRKMTRRPRRAGVNQALEMSGRLVAASQRRGHPRPRGRGGRWTDAHWCERGSYVNARSRDRGQWLQRSDVRGSRALETLLGVVAHLRAFSQRLEAVARDG